MLKKTLVISRDLRTDLRVVLLVVVVIKAADWSVYILIR